MPIIHQSNKKNNNNLQYKLQDRDARGEKHIN